MKTIYHLVEVNALGEFNIFTGTENECKEQMDKEMQSPFKPKSTHYYISMNRFN